MEDFFIRSCIDALAKTASPSLFSLVVKHITKAETEQEIINEIQRGLYATGLLKTYSAYNPPALWQWKVGNF